MLLSFESPALSDTTSILLYIFFKILKSPSLRKYVQVLSTTKNSQASGLEKIRLKIYEIGIEFKSLQFIQQQCDLPIYRIQFCLLQTDYFDSV